MQHAEIRGRMAERIGYLLAGNARLPKPLRSYQTETFEKTRSWLIQPSASPRGHVVYPTGLGKTMLFVVMAGISTGLRTLIVVPTRVLIEQTARAVAAVTGGIVGHLSSLGNITDTDGKVVAVPGIAHSDIVITTDRSLRNYEARIARDFGPHVIARDECHWSYSSSALDVLDRFPEAVIIGYSATPNYLSAFPMPGYEPITLDNGTVLHGNPERFASRHFGTAIDERSLTWGVEQGWLAPLAWGSIDLDTSLDAVPIVEGMGGLDYQEAELNRTLFRGWSKVCAAVQREYKRDRFGFAGRHVFAVCPGVKAAKALADAVSAIGVPAACITGETTPDARNRILSSFDRGEVGFLSSVTVLREGWDAPAADVCLQLRLTQSYLFYAQSMGRILRPSADGRKVALVVDAYVKGSRLAPLSAPMLFGTPGSTYEQGDMLLKPLPSQANRTLP